MLKACCHSLCKYSWLYSYYTCFFYFVGLNIDSWMFDILSYCFAVAIFSVFPCVCIYVCPSFSWLNISLWSLDAHMIFEGFTSLICSFDTLFSVWLSPLVLYYPFPSSVSCLVLVVSCWLSAFLDFSYLPFRYVFPANMAVTFFCLCLFVCFSVEHPE